MKNYALINYKTKEDAETAKSHMDNADIDGIKIVVKFEESNKESLKSKVKSPAKT